MADFGKVLIAAGIVLILACLFFSLIGRLPGDIYIKKENFTFYFPITSSILFSILISLVFYLFSRFFR